MEKKDYSNGLGLGDGSLLAARYAFMPNKLRYCGGDKNKEIFDYVVNGQSDEGLKNLLSEFATMYPYLKLIATANRIADPFNYRVVEAYWIGNNLLNNVSMNDLYWHMTDNQKVKKKFKGDLLERVFGKIPKGAKPHHSWHVLNIPKVAKDYPVEESLETMEKCRISWGQVIDLNDNDNSHGGFIKKIKVKTQTLLTENGKIKLGPDSIKEVWSEFNDQAFVKKLKTKDWVSFHWDWVCDVLNINQVRNLDKWTKHNINLANFLLNEKK